MDKKVIRRKNLQFVFAFFSIIALFLWFVIISPIIQTINEHEVDDPTYYDTGNMEDMTKEEYEDFLKWKENQDKKEKMFD